MIVKSMYQIGYEDGYRRKPVAHPKRPDYVRGHAKGIEDKNFVDAYSDEAMGIHPNEGP